MKSLDYLRQARKYIQAELMPGFKSNAPEIYKSTKQVLDSAQKAVKFVLPPYGRIFDDNLGALNDTIILPFPEILIEYEMPLTGSLAGNAIRLFGTDATLQCPKRIILARQINNGDIYLNCIFFRYSETGAGSWCVEPFQMRISQSEEAYNSIKDTEPTPKDAIRTDLKLTYNYALQPGYQEYFNKDNEDWIKHAHANMSEELRPVFELIEALSCTNVGYQKIKRTGGLNTINRGSLPYDEYHTLVIKTNKEITGPSFINCSHRSPREHIRRGHIRICSSGKKVWVQATIVNANEKGGKIIKDYALA